MKKHPILFTVSLLLLAVLFQNCRKKTYYYPGPPSPEKTDTIRFGALLSLTGNWNSLGKTSQAALEIALEEINQHMELEQSGYFFITDVYDTKLDTALALQYAAAAAKAGIQVLFGPQSSAEAGAVKSFADRNELLIVSQGSTAGSLSIAGDNLFRFCPADDVEGKALAAYMHREGIRSIITLARDDAGNRGLQASTGAAFSARGGVVTALPPYGIAQTDFTAELDAIRAQVYAMLTTHPASEVAVYLASFDECVELFGQALAGDPVLSSVRWFGGDGTALSTAISGDPAAAAFAVAVNYMAPAYGLPEESKHLWEPLSDKIKLRTGISPDAFALATYDAAWVAALAYAAAQEDASFNHIKGLFQVKADQFSGATGSTLLNAAGDRATGSFDFWGLESRNGTFSWVLKGRSEN